MTLRQMFALVVVSLTGGLLLYLVVRHSVPAYLAQVSPEAAVRFRSSQPDALVKLVEHVLDPQFGVQAAAANPPGGRQGEQPGAAAAPAPQPEPAEALGFAHEGFDLAVAQRMAERAVLADPLNARAFQLLGEVAARQGDEARSYALMKAATHRSLHESGAMLALLKGALLRSDYSEAAYDIDALLRVRPKLLPYLVPALAVMSERKEARAFVVQLISDNPPWREGFFDQLPRSVANIHTPGELLLGLMQTAGPPTRRELSAYLSFLVSKRLYQQAYGYWVQFLAPDQLQDIDLLYNGDFREQPSGLPFDWEVISGLGYTAEVASGYLLPSAHGMSLQFNGARAEFRPISELRVLAPGIYTVKGLWHGTIVSKRGLEWQMKCVETDAVLASSQLFHSNAAEWTPFQFEVTVPADSCPAQRLTLALDARSQSETLIDGSIWFSKLEIVQQ